MRHSMIAVCLILTVAVSGLVACETPATEQTDCTDIAPGQGASATCCPEWGLDACGAGLFCAALNGRTIPTCYVEHSQAGLLECDEDLHCLSFSCNAELRQCRSLPAQKCRVEVGCSAVSTTYEYVCDAATVDVDGTCGIAGSETGDLCLENDGCDSGLCVDRRCVLPSEGADCMWGEDCDSGICVNLKCATGENGADCISRSDCNDYMWCVEVSDGDWNNKFKCSNGEAGSVCNSGDDRCLYPGYCFENVCYSGAAGDPCEDKCNTQFFLACIGGICAPGKSTGEACTSDDQCLENTDGATYQSVCDPTKKKCLRTYNGYCETNAQCQSGKCVTLSDYTHRCR